VTPEPAATAARLRVPRPAVGRKVSTNLATVVFPDGTLALGVGTEANTLGLWLP